MRYKVPNIPTFTGLTGIDKRIQDIQQQLTFTWLEYSFGLCKRIVINDSIVPVCFSNNKSDTIDMRPFPDDSWKSYAFWDQDDSNEFNYADNISGAKRYPSISYNVSCLFIIDLNKASTKNYKVAHSDIRQDIINFFNQLRFAGNFAISSMNEKNITDIFKGYTIENPEIVLKDNISCFRVNGVVTFKQDCNE